MIDSLLMWPLTYLLHSSLFLIAAWGLDRMIRRPEWSEILWRCALFGGLITASLQPALHTWSRPADAVVQASQVIQLASTKPLAALVSTKPTSIETPRPAHVDTQSNVQSAPQSTTHAWTLTLPEETQMAVVAGGFIWLLVSAFRLLLLAVQWSRLRRTIRRLPRCESEIWQKTTQDLARRFKISTPALHVSDQWSSPLVGPGGAICLPRWSLDQLGITQIEAMLAHEIAHLKRHDVQWRIAARITACVGWWQPLNRLAMNRLDALAEQACDDRAAHATGSRTAMADALYVIARVIADELHANHGPSLAVNMAREKSSLMQRIETLMEGSPMSTSFSRRHLLWLLAIPLAAVFLLPLVAIDGIPMGPDDWHDLLHVGRGPRVHIVSTSPGKRLEASIDGKVILSETLDDLQSVDAKVVIKERANGHTKRIQYTPGAAGKIERHYSVDGHEYPIDADALRWIDSVKPVLLQNALNPKEQIARMIAHGGIDAAMNVIQNNRDGNVQTRLIAALFADRVLDDNVIQQSIAVLATVKNADYDRHLALRAIANTQKLNDDNQRRWLASVAVAGGDYDRRETLIALSPQLGTDTESIAAWHTTLASIGSDFDRRSVVESLLARKDISESQLAIAVQASTQMQSDFDHRTVLENVAAKIKQPSPALISAYATSAGKLKEPFDRRSALLAIIAAAPLDKAGCLDILAALENIGAQFDLTTVLVALAQKMPGDAEIVARYRQLAHGLDNNERGQVEQALDHLKVG